jgi:hypothetical protein
LRRPRWQQHDSFFQLQGIRCAGPQQGHQQRRDRNPAQKVKIRQWKYQDLQNGRNNYQKPGAGMNFPHLSE